MPGYLQGIKIVDLRHSELDLPENKNDAGKVKALMFETGEFAFKKKVYINFFDKGRRPPYWFTWCRYSPNNNYRDLYEWKVEWGYTPVNRDTDPFWPEPVAPNAEGNYVRGDLILVKIPLADHLKRKLEEQAVSNLGARAKLKQFNAAMRRSGAELPPEMIDRLMGELPGEGRYDEGVIPADILS